MDCELVVYSKKSIEEYALTIKKIFEDMLGESIDYCNKITYIAISHKYMSLSLEIEELNGLDVIKEDLDFEGNISIRIQLFWKTYNDGIKIIFNLIKFLIMDTNDNIIFIENGSNVILKRTNNTMYSMKSDYDNTEYPFYLLEEDVHII